MKSCPTCHRTYTDASLNFCLEDGTPLTVNAPLTGPINRRIVGVYKDGQAQVTLDSFSGTVSIVKAMAGTQTGCK